MKLILVVAFLISDCILLLTFITRVGLATPTSKAKEDRSGVPFNIKRDVEYRNTLLGSYVCRIQKAADAVGAKLQVSECGLAVVLAI